MKRREFLEGLAAAASIQLIKDVRALSAYGTESPKLPPRIKAFSIDFNWSTDPDTKKSHFAPPGYYAEADPEQHIRWYHDLGANVIQTFAVSCNGFAWYRNGFVPAEPGLKYDFLPEMVRQGHKRNMLVMGYFCVGANSKWGNEHPDLSYGAPPSGYHIPLTDKYLDYLSRSIADAIQKCDMDGFVIDWVWNPKPIFRASGWLPAEQRLFEQLTGKTFPTSGLPDTESTLEYERKAIDRCWARIKETRDLAAPRCIIWLSCFDFTNPTVADSRLLKEVDWAMNEAPDISLFRKGKEMVGPNTRMIQNVVGWLQHDTGKFLSDPANRELDLYGFAMPRPNSIFPPINDYLRKSMACFVGNDKESINDRNIAALARFYRGMPIAEDETHSRCG